MRVSPILLVALLPFVSAKGREPDSLANLPGCADALFSPTLSPNEQSVLAFDLKGCKGRDMKCWCRDLVWNFRVLGDASQFCKGADLVKVMGILDKECDRVAESLGMTPNEMWEAMKQEYGLEEL